jgi:hypothetical protein
MLVYIFLVSLCFVGSFAFLTGAWWASDHTRERLLKEERSGYSGASTGNNRLDA